MDATAFEAALGRDGFTGVEVKALEPGRATPPHAHPFEVRALVLDGDITLTVDGRQDRYGAGQVFTMAAGHPHAETVGPDGVRYLVGRRAAAA
ncbi:cupin domain-containing protein [Roseomonas sp. NAR14]|uniref:Cupin domain-containing protein n=1 Tax=Roseomonas acroporae TaxID=2937791 RepID=A0A9X1YKK9_9PROT|nr:cupin domain-containing protein [Roseomonas acroporae]MCK8787711.1 cupin domain-containing protein [Roseomonas acroporae]